MNKCILLTKLSPTEVDSPEDLCELGNKVTKKLQEKLNKVNWLANYAVCGPYDFVDIFEAETNEIAMKVSVIVRSTWNTQTEIWPVTDINLFKNFVLSFEDNIHERQPAEDIVDEISMDSFPASDPPSSNSIA